MLDRLVELVQQLGHWGYLIIFLGATLESSAFLGLIVPGESLVVFGGFLVARGDLHLRPLVVWVSIGAIVGDSIGYELGRRLGRPWLLRYGRWVGVRPEHLARADAFFLRRGGQTVFIGRFIGFLRALAPFVAGSARMRYASFLAYNASGAVLWSVVFVGLGYSVGASWQVAERWIGRASAVVGGALLLVGALGWLWGWMVRHEDVLRQRWARFAAHPHLRRLRRWGAPLAAFLQSRLTPGEYLGLHLTIGLAILATALWLYRRIIRQLVAGGALAFADDRVAAWLAAQHSPGLTAVLHTAARLGESLPVSVLAVLAMLGCLTVGRWYPLLSVAVSVPGAVLLSAGFATWAPNTVVPSSVTLNAVVLYGLFGILAAQALHGWRWRVLAALAAALVIAVVSFSALYLAMYRLSDALAGAAIGVAWLSVCVTAVETLRRGREQVRLRVGPPRVGPPDRGRP